MHCNYVFGWNLPNAKFLNEFAIKHDRTSLNIHLPKMSSKWIKWHKDYLGM